MRQKLDNMCHHCLTIAVMAPKQLFPCMEPKQLSPKQFDKQIIEKGLQPMKPVSQQSEKENQ